MRKEDVRREFARRALLVCVATLLTWILAYAIPVVLISTQQVASEGLGFISWIFLTMADVIRLSVTVTPIVLSTYVVWGLLFGAAQFSARLRGARLGVLTAIGVLAGAAGVTILGVFAPEVLTWLEGGPIMLIIRVLVASFATGLILKLVDRQRAQRATRRAGTLQPDALRAPRP